MWRLFRYNLVELSKSDNEDKVIFRDDKKQ